MNRILRNRSIMILWISRALSRVKIPKEDKKYSRKKFLSEVNGKRL